MTGMQARIHRGATEIGGSCVELRCDGQTILLDLGRPLWATRDDQIPLPAAIGLGEPGPLPLAVVISHGHQDHWGLVPDLPEEVPVWIGKGAADVLRTAQFWGTGVDLGEAGHLTHRQPFQIGPFTITPYLADHSGFDAYSLLVEAGGARLFYSGDVRGHGRKHRAFDWLLDDPPGDVDVLMLEGTNLRAAYSGNPTVSPEALATESDVEDDMAAIFTEHPGLAVVLSSAQNLDRLVTTYRAALRANRSVAVDLYTAEVAAATGRDTIPHLGAAWPRLSTFVPRRQRVQVKTAGQFDHVSEVRDYRIFEEALRTDAGRWVLYGAYQSTVGHLLQSGMLAQGCVVWSLWDGYLTEPRGVALLDDLAQAGIPLIHHHTSGHASPADLRRLAAAINATIIVPIHTEAPDRYANAFGRRVTQHADGQWWTIPELPSTRSSPVG